MNTDYFLEFTVLAELENYAEAADRLSISESSLSRHIKALETELGVRLFDRTSRTVRINPYGKIFLPYANQFLDMQEKYTSEIAKTRKKAEKSVIISTAYYVDDFLAQFHLYHKDIRVISISNGQTVDRSCDMLRQGMCELVFVIDPQDPGEEFEILPYTTDSYVAVLPTFHPLAKESSVPLSALSDEDYISFKDNSYSDVQLKELCRKSGFEPNITFTADVGSAIASFVRDGIGISLLLKHSISKNLPGGVALVDIEPEAKLNICICYMKNNKLSKPARQILEFTRNIWPDVKG